MNTIKRRVQLTTVYGSSLITTLKLHHQVNKQSKVTLWDLAQIRYQLENKNA